MPANTSSSSRADRERALTSLHRDVAERRTSYRARALGMFPHICASCSREFEGRRLKELTVHHKDHDHNRNPPDGSNWELLCLYCHDHEHEKHIDAKHYDAGAAPKQKDQEGLANPFSGLDGLL